MREKPLLRAALAVALGFALLAAPPAHAALTYDLGLGVGVEGTDNVNLAPETPPEGVDPPLSSTITTYVGSVALDWEERDATLSLDYRGAYQDYGGEGEELDAEWIHQLSANFGWRRWSPFFLDVRESRDRVQQYRDEREAELRNRTDRNVVSVRPGFAWDVGRTGRLEIAARGEQQTFPGAEEGDDSTGWFGDVSYERRWTPLWRSTLRLEYGDVSREIGQDFTQVQAGVSVSQSISPLLDASYSLAWRRDSHATPDDSEEEGGDSDYLLLGVGLNGRPAPNLSWGVSYADRVETLVDGETLEAGRFAGECSLRSRLGSTLDLGVWHERRSFQMAGEVDRAWGPTADARWRAADSWALTLHGAWTRTEREEGGTELELSDLASASVGVAARLWRHVELEAGYRLLRNDSSLAERSYRSAGWHLGVTAYLQPFAPGHLP